MLGFCIKIEALLSRYHTHSLLGLRFYANGPGEAALLSTPVNFVMGIHLGDVCLVSVDVTLSSG